MWLTIYMHYVFLSETYIILWAPHEHTDDMEAIPEERLKLDMELPVFLLKPKLVSIGLSLSVWSDQRKQKDMNDT